MSIMKAATRAATTIATATMLATGVAHAESPAAQLDSWYMSGNPLGTCFVSMTFADYGQFALEFSDEKKLRLGIVTPGIEKSGFSKGQTAAVELIFDVDRHAKVYV